MGTLFIIEYMQVDKPWRKKGLRKCMVSCLMDKASSWGPDFIFLYFSLTGSRIPISRALASLTSGNHDR
jgi:hypothetical protein